MATTQTATELRELLERLSGREIARLQVLGINSLKSVSPALDALTGQTVVGSEVADRTITVHTTEYRVVIDLQRAGQLVWLTKAQPYAVVAGANRPTVRLILTDDEGFDLTEPAKTKRITVTLIPVKK